MNSFKYNKSSVNKKGSSTPSSILPANVYCKEVSTSLSPYLPVTSAMNEVPQLVITPVLGFMENIRQLKQSVDDYAYQPMVQQLSVQNDILINENNNLTKIVEESDHEILYLKEKIAKLRKENDLLEKKMFLQKVKKTSKQTKPGNMVIKVDCNKSNCTIF